MGYAKQKGTFEILAKKLSDLTIYDDKSLKIITDIFEQYSHLIRILKNKNPETFSSQYENELQQVKTVKRVLKTSEEVDAQDAFIKYRDALIAALNAAINAAK